MAETYNSINANVNNPYPNEHLVYWDCKRNFVYFNKKTKNLGVYIYIYISNYFSKKKTHTHYIIYFTLHFKNVIFLSSFLLFYLSHNKNIKK